MFALLTALPSSAQAPSQAGPDATQLRRPADIYREAMHPLDVVRSSLDNWSDSELGALAAGMHQAREACGQARPEDYSGEDLYDLARLCALGQDWNSTLAVTQRYIAGEQVSHRARAYAMEVNALIQINDLPRAVATTQEMLGKLPYDAAVSESTAYITTYLEQALDADALVLALQEHGLIVNALIVSALHQGVPLGETNGTDAVSVGSLYESGMELAFLERYAGADGPAAQVVEQLKLALPQAASLSVEDRRLIQSVDTRYGLLGAPQPAVEILKSLGSSAARPVLKRTDGLATVLVLFPEWCTQCRKLMTPMTALAQGNPAQGNPTKGGSGKATAAKANQAKPAPAKSAPKFAAYGLMFQNTVVDADSPLKDETQKDLQGTSTLLVSPATAVVFGATEFPMGIVQDKRGNIVYVGLLPSNAFVAKGLIDEIVQRKSAGQSILAVIDTTLRN
jgi:hypothetical protein